MTALVPLSETAEDRSEAMNEGYGCPNCNDGWTCEAHPGFPWPHPMEEDPEGECAGPGMPCANGCLKLDSRGVPVMPNNFSEVWRRPDLQP